MELFHEIYSCYFHTVRHILESAAGHPISRREIERLCSTYAFQETSLTILPNLTGGAWPLLHPSQGSSHGSNCQSGCQRTCTDAYESVLLHTPKELPLTALQRSWLAALLQDARFHLFFTDEELAVLSDALKSCEPLYRQEDFHYFDRFGDGDSYHESSYRKHFQTILSAIREHRALLVCYQGKSNVCRTFEMAPYQLQFSQKDNKFRLSCLQYRPGHHPLKLILNLERIKDCHLSSERLPDSLADTLSLHRFTPVHKAKEPVLLKISGERNSLERCMLHFANYEKHTEYDEQHDCWLCSIYYDIADETELLIDVLSFGPVVEVLGPESFLGKVRRRVRRQHELLHSHC